MSRWLELNWQRHYPATMNTAEKIFEKTQQLTPSAQKALLEIVELLAGQPGFTGNQIPKAGSAKGQIKLAPDFDAPLEDFKPYME